jgi:hypothetical protein
MMLRNVVCKARKTSDARSREIQDRLNRLRHIE